MSRPRFKIRELLLIGAPIVGIIGGAGFLSRQQAIREGNRNGPYRAEITKIDVLPVSPFEAWQGFDTKIVVHVRDFGHLTSPEGHRLSPNRILDECVLLCGSINGQSKNLPVSSVGSAGSSSESANPGALQVRLGPSYTESEQPEMSLTYLAATSKFDANSKIYLRGDIWFHRDAGAAIQMPRVPTGWTTRKTGSYIWLETQSKRAPLNQPLERVPFVNVDHTAPSVVKVQADLLSPVYAHSTPLGDIGNNRSGVVCISFNPKSLPDPLPRLSYTDVQIFDSSGREVEMKDASGSPNWDSTFASPNSAIVRLPIQDVPLERGALKMKMWLAFEDGWPTLIQADVRPAWMSKRPRALHIQSVRVEGGNVVVSAYYSGKSPIEYQDRFRDQNWGHEEWLFFDGRDNDKMSRASSNLNYKRFYTYWSQHFTLPNGKSYWLPNAVNVQSVNCDATDHCRIAYKTSALKALKPGQSAHFSAQIGLDGDGFLPIQATITRPKK